MMKWFSFVSKRSKVTVTSNIQQKYSGQYSAPQFRSSDLAGVCVSVCGGIQPQSGHFLRDSL